MREIKYRVWDRAAKEYVDGMVLDVTKMSASLNERFILESFTGLKDNSGQEIFEGDISTLESHGIYVCKWSKKFTAFKWEEKDMGKVDGVIKGYGNMTYFCGELSNIPIEIIGNIHQNPELLK